MRFLVVLLLIGLTCALPAQQSNRIVGGTPVPIEKYPFMVSMQVTWEEGVYGHSCGGSLITRAAVLSAAHCYYNPYIQVTQWRARIGSENRYTGGTHHRIAQIIMHPNYIHVLLRNDVALVRLATPAILSDKVQPARIAGPNYPLQDNLRVYVAGWGARHHEDHDTSDILLHTDVRVINQEICAERYAELKTHPDNVLQADVTPDMVCTGHFEVGGQDACQGDSGGPVIHGGDIVVGVTSWGHECGHPLYPGVNARVSSYTQWIVDNAVF